MIDDETGRILIKYNGEDYFVTYSSYHREAVVYHARYHASHDTGYRMPTIDEIQAKLDRVTVFKLDTAVLKIAITELESKINEW